MVSPLHEVAWERGDFFLEVRWLTVFGIVLVQKEYELQRRVDLCLADEVIGEALESHRIVQRRFLRVGLTYIQCRLMAQIFRFEQFLTPMRNPKRGRVRAIFTSSGTAGSLPRSSVRIRASFSVLLGFNR